MKKINVIQFLPYFPPHKGGVETVGEEIGKYWIKKDFGGFINVVSYIEQDLQLDINEKILYQDKIIGYRKDGYEVLLVPSFELINNFPVFKFWSEDYRLTKKYLNERILKSNDETMVFTHTRFFLSSLFGGIFARKNKLKWIHIEHGSDYVKLGSKIKTFLSVVYDKIIGRWIFRRADKLIGISGACRKFINREFIDKQVDVFYRGLDLTNIDIDKSGDFKIVFVGRLVVLKGVVDLIEAYKLSGLKNELVIIGDGEERQNLQKISTGLNVKFLGFKDRDFVLDYLSKNNCVLVNPSYQEGMPTTVIEGLATGCVVVGSDVGGTREITSEDDLVLFERGDVSDLKEKLKRVLDEYEDLKGHSLLIIREKFDREVNVFSLYDLIK
ncbi:MAG: glycosyltransferase family 4 protein [Candidatus Gracilibacteria bacterium]|nr:glycosyltransferase family 4 protein [Candidatus Gracilibacteria bacterium]